jgi:hypothetical protein
MKFLISLLMCAMLPGSVLASHSCPKTGTRETFYLGVTAYEHDPDGAAWVKISSA